MKEVERTRRTELPDRVNVASWLREHGFITKKANIWEQLNEELVYRKTTKKTNIRSICSRNEFRVIRGGKREKIATGKANHERKT